RLTNVRRFAADCLLHANAADSISQLEDLESLSIGIYDLEGFDFLSDLRANKLKALSLGATFSKKPSLRVIERFRSIETLHVEGQDKDIEVIGGLPHLQDLTLRSVTVASLGFLRGLSSLWSIDIKLGGTRNLAALANLVNVKYLELWQIRGLNDLSPISEMTGLQFLFLQSLRNVTRLPDFSR